RASAGEALSARQHPRPCRRGRGTRRPKAAMERARRGIRAHGAPDPPPRTSRLWAGKTGRGSWRGGRARRGQRADHDEVALGVATELEGVLSDHCEAGLLIEANGAGVALPYSEPERGRAGTSSAVDGARHQIAGQSRALERRFDVEPAQFPRRACGYACGCIAAAELDVADQPAGVMREQCDGRRIFDLDPLPDFTESARAVLVHVRGCVVYGESVAKRRLRESGQIAGVLPTGDAYRPGALDSLRRATHR